MKIFFDTNVYIAEALLGRAAERMIAATAAARWRIYCSRHVLDEMQTVMLRLGFTGRLATLAQDRIRRRSTLVMPAPSRHAVPSDPHDSPILRAALACGADYLVTNDQHLLELNPYEGLEIVSMVRYMRIIRGRGLLD